MHSLLKFKPVLSGLAIVILLSGCSISREDVATESLNTIASRTDAKSTQTAQTTQAIASQKTSPSTESIGTPKTPSSTQAEATQKESDIFSGIEDYKIENPKTYHDERFKFSVDYPAAWKVQLADGETIPPHPDGRPESGIIIYVDSNKNDWMYIYGAAGYVDPDWDLFTLRNETITTTDGVKGNFCYENIGGNIVISLVLEDAHHGANITMTEASFQKHKAQIYGILKSIKVNK